MSLLHLFNPENDMALAVNEPNYTPPRAALRLRRAASLLPMWWANKDDAILVEDDMNAEAELLRTTYGLGGHPVKTAPEGFIPEPWGWSAYTRKIFYNAGVASGQLPSTETITEIRNLSHRRLTIKILKHLGTPEQLLPVEAFSVKEAFEAINRFGRAVIKLPWSSSGRGIIYSTDVPTNTLKQYIAGIIHRQGSALVEPYYNREQDFAALFYSDGTTVTYRGCSLFATDTRGFYAGNIIMPQKELSQQIRTDFTTHITNLEDALTIFTTPSYSGWIGVDMLSYRNSSGALLTAPCIEVNMRRTMGVAALYIADKLCHHRPHLLNVTPEGIAITPLQSVPSTYHKAY